jgi:8-oxo-dGTP pyrophosphatase MutT (NUDIX family)
MIGMSDEKNYNRQDLLADLHDYNPIDAKEISDKLKMIDLIQSTHRCFDRNCFPAHVTGSALLLNVEGDKILMNYHGTLKKWLSFGGHADGEEDILCVAIRETMEESGITLFKPLSATIADIDIHPIPENSKRFEPAHFHYDIRYVMQMTSEQNPVISDESIQLKWMRFDEALEATKDDSGMNRFISKLK